MSRTSLHRRIKSVTTMTTGEVINAYRLKKAAALLPENYTIAEVAFKTGFATPAYFSKCFRELYNITPTAYIKKVKLPIKQQAKL
jgi:AraC-like DNA-binding protein